MANVSTRTAVGRELRESAVEREQAAHEAWRAADPEGAAGLDDAMAAAEGFAGEADPFAGRREQAARDEARAELMQELELEAG
jgi:hypothetical protein